MLSPLRVLLSCRGRPASRLCSGYVARMRYLSKLKTDDDACLIALQSATVHLFHRLSPLLRRSPHGAYALPALSTTGTHGAYALPALSTTEVQKLVERVGGDRSMVEEHSVLIGCTEHNHAHFCLDVGSLEKEAVEETSKATFIDLRKAFFVLRGEQAPLVARGQALLRWHQGHMFCSATGQPTVRNQSGSQRVCRSSDITYYPTMSPAVIVLVSDGDRCLLARQPSFPPGMYSALAGFCDMGETVEEAVLREVSEEVGVEVNSVRYSGSQHWPLPRSSFMVACHADVNPAHTQLDIDRTELEDADWFTLDEVTAALRVKAPPPRSAPGQPIPFWVPPPYAIANRLIAEWAGQRSGSRPLTP